VGLQRGGGVAGEAAGQGAARHRYRLTESRQRVDPGSLELHRSQNISKLIDPALRFGCIYCGHRQDSDVHCVSCRRERTLDLTDMCIRNLFLEQEHKARDKRAAKAKMVGAIARSSCFWSAWWGWCVPRFHGRQYTASESEYVGASAGTRSG